MLKQKLRNHPASWIKSTRKLRKQARHKKEKAEKPEKAAAKLRAASKQASIESSKLTSEAGSQERQNRVRKQHDALQVKNSIARKQKKLAARGRQQQQKSKNSKQQQQPEIRSIKRASKDKSLRSSHKNASLLYARTLEDSAAKASKAEAGSRWRENCAGCSKKASRQARKGYKA
ncbi:hypothetical protein Tco_0573055 [Tanacetum coccineum]